MHRKFLMFLGLLISLFALLVTVAPAYAATSSNPSKSSTSSVDIASLQKNCSGMRIYLHGQSHTITCISDHQKAKIQPSVSRDNVCDQYIDNLVIWNYAYTKYLCFSGTGYLGVRIYDVNEVDDVGILTGWFLYYPGHYQGIVHPYQGGGVVLGTGTTNFLVTQLCYTNRTPPGC